MAAASILRLLVAPLALIAGAAALSGEAEARDRFAFSVGFDSWGASSIGFGYATGGHWGGHRNWGNRGWGHRGWGHRGWGGDRLSLGFTYVLPPAYYYGPRYFYPPAYYGAAPYGYPARPYSRSGYSPVGGVVVFSAPVRDRLTSRVRGVYYDAYRSALDAPVGEAITWRDGRIVGDVTTTRDGWAGTRYCREFRQNIVIDGNTEEAYGTACRNAADTDWEIIPD